MREARALQKDSVLTRSGFCGSAATLPRFPQVYFMSSEQATHGSTPTAGRHLCHLSRVKVNPRAAHAVDESFPTERARSDERHASGGAGVARMPQRVTATNG